MKIEVNIDKRYFIALIAFIGILGIVFITNAYGEGTPTIVGHSWSDIGDIPADIADGDQVGIETETDPIWSSEKSDYATKNYVDSNSGTGGSETDPIWSSEKSDYATRNYVDNEISSVSSGGAEIPCSFDGVRNINFPLVLYSRDCGDDCCSGSGETCTWGPCEEDRLEQTKMRCDGDKIVEIFTETYWGSCHCTGTCRVLP